jgi:hypothetical protein
MTSALTCGASSQGTLVIAFERCSQLPWYLEFALCLTPALLKLCMQGAFTKLTYSELRCGDKFPQDCGTAFTAPSSSCQYCVSLQYLYSNKVACSTRAGLAVSTCIKMCPLSCPGDTHRPEAGSRDPWHKRSALWNSLPHQFLPVASIWGHAAHNT